MKKKCFLILLLLLVFKGTSLGAERFLLQTELRANYNGGASGKVFTGYTYDESGNRIFKRVFDGIDSAAALMSREVLSYNANGQITQNLLLSATGDTLSIVRNTYGVSGLESASTLNKNGSTRFIDSMFYSGGTLAQQSRYNAAGAKTFLNRYTYTGGLLNADSLFEPDGAGGFAPTQARLVSHNGDSTVAQESQWRKSGSAWYAVSTTKMTYSQNVLLSTAVFETDGVSGALTDSLSYHYDLYGNRTKESHYDNERTLTYDIVYTWKDMEPPVVVASRNALKSVQRDSYRDGRIEFITPFTGILTVYSANGRKVSQTRIEKCNSAMLNCQAANGMYYAMLSGTTKETFPIIINN